MTIDCTYVIWLIPKIEASDDLLSLNRMSCTSSVKFAAEITGCNNFRVEHYIAAFEENVGMYPQIVHFKK